MTPTRRKVGRPAGLKNNKAKSGKNVKNIKTKTRNKTAKINRSCNACKKKFDTATKYIEHRNICAQLRKYSFSCNECTKKFRFERSYLNHIKNEHSKTEGSVPCKECSVKCPDVATLKIHVRDFHERQTYKCKYCGQEFVRWSHVQRHIAQKGCDGRLPTTYVCEICEAVFTRKDNLMAHLRMQHIERSGFTCKECSFHSEKFSKLILHVQKVHQGLSNKFECDHCGKVTSSRAAISKHMEIHGPKKYGCQVCGYQTFTIEVMRRHVLTHTEEKPFKCDICNKSFIQQAQIQRHLLKHTGNRCLLCGQVFKHKASLVLHSREHNGEKLKCPMADCSFKKEFDSEKTLSEHIKTHEERSYKCEICSSRFVTDLTMRRHMLTHTLERPRRCMYCVRARAYTRGEQLLKHVRKAHPDIFGDHLAHVRQVLGITTTTGRVTKSELESILGVLDAEADRIVQGYGEGVLYGGVHEQDAHEALQEEPVPAESPLMSEEELTENLGKLLTHLVDADTLQGFDWPESGVDLVLERVIQQCGAKVADRERWSRVQCLRENAKHLFLHVIEDNKITLMLNTHTIDQIVRHILAQITEDSDGEINEAKPKETVETSKQLQFYEI